MPSKLSAPRKRVAESATNARTSPSTPRTREGAAPVTRALTHEEIALRAHDLYVKSGFQGHREVEFWFEAERELREKFKV